MHLDMEGDFKLKAEKETQISRKTRELENSDCFITS